MKLSDYFEENKVIRDCTFEALGLSNSNPRIPFVSYLDNIRFLEEIINNELVVGIICKNEHIKRFREISKYGIVVSENPRKAYFELHNRLSNDEKYYPKLQKSQIGSGCKISKLAYIQEEGVVIGNNVTIDELVSVKGPCYIGDNCIIHSGSVIGGDGFEFKRYQENVLDVFHCGSVSIGHDVTIWENVTIHRGVYPWDSTVVGSWSRIGAQCHIDHGAKIKEFVEICARSIISGRTDIGNHTFIGPGSIVSNRIAIGDNAKVLIGSVVTKEVESEEIVSGNFAISHDKHLNRVVSDSQMVLR